MRRDRESGDVSWPVPQAHPCGPVPRPAGWLPHPCRGSSRRLEATPARASTVGLRDGNCAGKQAVMEHQITITPGIGAQGRTYVMQCACGWRAEDLHDREAAQALARDHESSPDPG